MNEAARAKYRSPIPTAGRWPLIQVAVDAKNKMIVDQAVTNQVVDIGLLKETAEPARTILEVATIDVVADLNTSDISDVSSRGTFMIEDQDRIAAREGGDDAVCCQAATGIIGEQRLFPQG